MRKVWAWIKARPRWLWGVLAGLVASVVLALQHDGAAPPPEALERDLEDTIPPPPPVLREEADGAKAEAERAVEAVRDLDADEVATGFERHARRSP